ncbi:MAG: hypothetical protein JSU96_19925 [Acidobacteriota bacterium]|nr:MAG: hypothetical protein JSU96_19925 [Acidobacteriota bacterium]
MRQNLLKMALTVLLMIHASHLAVAGQAVQSSDVDAHWIGPDGERMPFRSYLEIEQFLETARVTAVKSISDGITKPRKLTLEKDGVQLHAIFRYVDIEARKVQTLQGMRFEYRDAAVFELASYRLTRLLGMDCVPPVVLRDFSKEDFLDLALLKELPARRGTVQVWVENAMTEKHRLKGGIRPPDARSWARQRHMMTVFDNLIFNDDRNQGNILIGPDWKLWFIDATRAFRPFEKLRDPDQFLRCDRDFYERLDRLDDREVAEAMKGLLTPREVRALLKRVDRLMERLDVLIAAHGEQVVLFDQPGALVGASLMANR